MMPLSVAWKRWFLLPLGLYFLLTAVYLFAIPDGESPDEPGHLNCIEQVTLHNRLPIVDPVPQGDVWWARGRLVSGYMCYHMPLYYLAAGYFQQGIVAVTGASVPFDFPPINDAFGSTPNLFRHPEKTTFWQLGAPPTVTGLRLLSIVLGVFTLWASWQAAAYFFPRLPFAPLLAATLVAGIPQFVYLSRSLNNDLLATALAVTVLVMLLRVQRPQRFLWIALLAALAVLTKLSMMFVAAAVLAVWALEMWLAAAEERRRYLWALAAMLGIWAATAVLIGAHPLLRDHFRYGLTQFSELSAQARTAVYWWDVLRLTLSSGWARLGWMNLPAPEWHAYLWWIWLLLTAGVGVAAAWRGAQTTPARLRLAIAAIWWAGLLASYLRVNSNRLQPQFRFMLPLLPLLAAFSAGGVLWLLQARPVARRLAAPVLGFLLLNYNIWFVFAIVKIAYGW